MNQRCLMISEQKKRRMRNILLDAMQDVYRKKPKKLGSIEAENDLCKDMTNRHANAKDKCNCSEDLAISEVEVIDDLVGKAMCNIKESSPQSKPMVHSKSKYCRLFKFVI